MAVAAAAISGVKDYIDGNNDVCTRRLTFSGNYGTGGEAITAALFGLKVLQRIYFHGGVAMASALSTGCPISYDAANSKVVFFEGSAAGTALSEKTNAEAYPTGCFIDVTVVGR